MSVRETFSPENPSNQTSKQLQLKDIAIENIDPDPFQARLHFRESSIQELADSIAQYGLLSRLRVRLHPHIQGRYQLVYGERRLRALKLLRYQSVPCEIAHYTDEELKEIGLIENLQRENLTPLEEAKAFRNALDQGNSFRKLAQKIGKDKGYIEDRVALLTLPEDVKEVVEEIPGISLRALREIARLPTAAKRSPLLSELRQGTINIAAIRSEVNRILGQLHASPSPTPSENFTFQKAYHKTESRISSCIKELHSLLETYNQNPNDYQKSLINELIEPLRTVLKETDTLTSKGE